MPAVRLAVIYRPPPSNTNGLNYKKFYAEIGNYIEQYLVLTPGALVIACDFNIHVDDPSDKEAADILSLIESFGLKQHVSDPTHRTGHTLGIVLTRDIETRLHLLCHRRTTVYRIISRCSVISHSPRNTVVYS